jgi:UDP-N-acetyl-D-glucosamine dehydrogenase
MADSTSERVVGLVSDALNHSGVGFEGARVVVFGVACTRGIDDTRDSPAVEVIAALRRRGVDVCYADPHVPALWVDGRQIKAVDFSRDVLDSADCVLILTSHPEFAYAPVRPTGAHIC